MPLKNPVTSFGRVVTQHDEQPKKIATDVALNEVSADSEEAAFTWLPADLERARAQREEFGFEDKERAQKASREAELRLAERRLATEQARVDALRETVGATAGAAADKPAREVRSGDTASGKDRA